LNDPRYRGATVLLAGANFGCGSSREHAVWALLDSGYRAVIAPRIADIFRNNALRNGLVPVELSPDVFAQLVEIVRAESSSVVTVDVERRAVEAPGFRATFALDDFSRNRLLEGLDDIGLTLRHESDIGAFEAKRPEWLPRVR
jgi:3-isopropylmalate/(R)-2-methylmalate dehydratase small subunit